MNHDQLKELLPLEALGVLDGDEAREMTTHLAELCDECVPELRAFRETLAAMALTEAGETPADHIWQRLERRLEGNTTDSVASDRTGGRSTDRSVRRGESRGSRVGTALAASIAIVTTALAYHFSGQLSATQHAAETEVVGLDERVRDLDLKLMQRDRELISLRDQLATTSQMTRAVLAPDLRTIKLQPMPPAPDAAGLVAMSASRGHCVVEIAGLPPPPPDKTYELWWIGSKSGPVRAALFNPGPDGGATVRPESPPEGERILASAVTLEPAGGMNKPTGSMYLKGTP
jgi:anti-sigma-K factor RskA